jgi:tetratricopeptide (TPR) repeat protein
MNGKPLYQRAIALIETNRYADAEKMLRQGLAQDPQDAFGLTLLAICQLNLDKKTDALATVEQAVALAPDDPFVLTTHGRVLFHNNQSAKARSAIEAALQINPTNANAYGILAQIEYHEQRWEAALQNTEMGLEHDPEDQILINLRAMALVKLNRTAEAGATIDYALHNNPEDSFSHSNKGWVQIEQGRYDDAAASFKEALRLDPNNEHAREGLKEAIKGKNWLYRGVLRYFLFMSKLSGANQWLVVLGLWFGSRLLRSVAETNSALQPFIAPLLIAYLVFVFATWIGRPLSDLVLRLHPVGKFALSDDEKLFSNLVGICLALGIGTLVFGYTATADKTFGNDLNVLGIALFAMLIPIGGASATKAGSMARKVLVLYTLLMFAAGPLNQAYVAFVGKWPFSGTLLIVYSLGIFLYGWVANVLISWAARRF